MASYALSRRDPDPEVGSLFGKLGRFAAAAATGGASEAARLALKKKKRNAAEWDIRKMTPAAIIKFQLAQKQVAGGDYVSAILSVAGEVGATPHASTDTRQRIDYRDNPDKSVTCILTMSFPGGIIKRFETTTHPEEVEAIAGEIVGAEFATYVGGLEYVGDFDEVGWNPFKAIAKGAKAVGKLARKVAASKVFALAATALAVAAPLLGPVAPALLGAAAAMGVAAKLAKAKVASLHGALGVAASLTASAGVDARALTTTPAGAAALLASADAKRLGAEAIADGTRGTPTKRPAKRPAPRRKAKARPAARPAARPVARPAVRPVLSLAAAASLSAPAIDTPPSSEATEADASDASEPFDFPEASEADGFDAEEFPPMPEQDDPDQSLVS